MSFEFDLTAPFLPEFSTKDQSEHRHKIRPVQILAPSSSNGFRLNEGGLSSVLAHSAIANKKVISSTREVRSNSVLALKYFERPRSMASL
ncbi:hypothetical protein Q1695_006087 [Nippostrongylus brasiliensis]|nr:hypothetical protein Q1695_006087 [Nippostrongylus brasiliensis]